MHVLESVVMCHYKNTCEVGCPIKRALLYKNTEDFLLTEYEQHQSD